MAAAQAEETTLTLPEMQDASNAVALSVFRNLQLNEFVFNDAPTAGQPDFSPISIIARDAGMGLLS